MRLFLALKVPELDHSDDRFRKLGASLDKSKIEHKFVPTEQLHIPLVEIGDLGRGSFMAVYEKLKSIKERVPPFRLKLTGLWGFPHQEEADMLWVGVHNSRELRFLHGELSELLQIPTDSFFRPHIPLIYLKRKKNVTDVISPFKRFEFSSILIDEVRIMEKLSGGAGVRMVGSYQLYDPGLTSHPSEVR